MSLITKIKGLSTGKKIGLGIVTVVIIGVVASQGEGKKLEVSGDKDKPAVEAKKGNENVAEGRKEDKTEATQSKDKKTDTDKKDTSGETKSDSSSKVSIEYKSALAKAKVYGETMNMSKAGIYDQLTSEYGEKFSKEAAKYAVDNVKLDYNELALKKAEIYQKTMAMSQNAIYDQLTSENGEKFTDAQAKYAVDHLSK